MTVNNRPLHWFTCAIAFCTYLLILAGATVTSHRAGLSVPDWPNTYGHFMFSFPLSKMVGGIFWEHGHRLIASTVGFFTIILAVWLARTEQRPWVKRLGWIALAAVIFQGILGGLTVRFYLPALVSVAHAATAQAFFCLTIALAFFTSRKWTDAATPAPHARMLRWFAVATTVAIYLQLILGATIRHANAAVIAHIIGAVVVLLCVGVTGMAVITAGKRKDILAAAVALTSLVIVQMVLGVVSLVIRVPKHEHGQLAPAEIWWPTAHLAVGALILAVSFHLTLKCFRHLQTTGEKKDLPLRDYLELAKPRIVTMVLVTATLGYFMAHGTLQPIPQLILMLLGVGLSTGGSAVLNNFLERESDAKMTRTKDRALPAGLILPEHALGLGITLVLAGVLVLGKGVNLLTAFLVLLASFLYVLVYTPMKKLTWLNTTFGAIPGAIPPLCGWAAAAGKLDTGAWILFAILFAWQHPHFFAIAWMFRDDYANAGFKMLPVVEPAGRSTFRQTIFFSTLLIGVSVLPVAIGMAGKMYLFGALAMGLGLLATGIVFTRAQSIADARRLLKASVIYLPLLLILIIVDAGF